MYAYVYILFLYPVVQTVDFESESSRCWCILARSHCTRLPPPPLLPPFPPDLDSVVVASRSHTADHRGFGGSSIRIRSLVVVVVVKPSVLLCCGGGWFLTRLLERSPGRGVLACRVLFEYMQT